MAEWLVGRVAGWLGGLLLVGWFLGLLVGWLVGWLVGCLLVPSNQNAVTPSSLYFGLHHFALLLLK